MKALGWILAATGLVGALASFSPLIQANATIKYQYLLGILVFIVIGVIGLGLVIPDTKR